MMSTDSYNLEDIEQQIIKELIKRLSSEDFDINKTDECGITLLHIACGHGMISLCKVLLENYASTDVPDVYGRTPLMIGCMNGHRDVVELLLIKNASLMQKDMYAVTHAMYSGDSEMFMWLYSKRDFVQESTTEDTYLGEISPLSVAASLGLTEIGKYIISKSPEQINLPVRKTGMTPLMLAICGRHTEMIELLIDCGANLQAMSNGKISSIGYARKQSLPILKLNVPAVSVTEVEETRVHKRRAHPLTPNLYISPLKKVSSPKKCLSWIKFTIRPKRSKSLDKERTDKNETNEEDNVLKSILELAKMDQYWPIFKEQEINFKTFLTLDEEDLKSVGISKPSAKLKFLNIIEHYKKIFNSK